eukprot:TRINITY_DN32995_c0_g1_i1.p1 TRINITY_DN32995_c0_g1~~TRINITY_DN32995_c0_g1_i1.p1  ORF type:complete len:253 (-),score=50.03 TRINITY_DN32995_c0_g1_i1:100-858(-)
MSIQFFADSLRSPPVSSDSRTVWLGQEFVDESTRQTVRKVIVSATVMAMFQVGAVTLGLLETGLSQSTLSAAALNLLVGLLLPAAGFFGAAKSNSKIMCCFCGSNLLLAFAQTAMLVLIGIALWQSDDGVKETCESSCLELGCGNVSRHCSCAPGCIANSTLFCCYDFIESCSPALDTGDRVDCFSLQQNITAALVTTAVVFALIMAPSVALSLYAWWHGMALWQRLSAGEFLVAGDEQKVSFAGGCQEPQE